jgi:hypothetical protein
LLFALLLDVSVIDGDTFVDFGADTNVGDLGTKEIVQDCSFTKSSKLARFCGLGLSGNAVSD